MAELKSKSAFGSKENLQSALDSGVIDEYDRAYLSNGEIAWVDKDKNIVMNTPRTQESHTLNGVSIGALSDGDTLPSDITFDEFIKLISEKAIPATYTKPALNIANNGGQASGNVEAGTSITPKLKSTFTKNDAGELTAISIKQGSVVVADGTTTPLTYSGDAIVIGDETITFSASATYGDAPVKKNNLGQESTENWFAGGTINSGSYSIVGKRKTFWGAGVGTIETPTSDIIRGMVNSKLNQGAGTVSLKVETGSQHILFALPSGRTLSQVCYDDLGDKGMLSSFTKTTVKVADVRGGENGLMDYNCYVYNLSSPCAAPMNFTFTIV